MKASGDLKYPILIAVIPRKKFNDEAIKPDMIEKKKSAVIDEVR